MLIYSFTLYEQLEFYKQFIKKEVITQVLLIEFIFIITLTITMEQTSKLKVILRTIYFMNVMKNISIQNIMKTEMA